MLTACERKGDALGFPPQHVNKADIQLANLISVVVCSYNPRPEYMRRVIAALRAQILPLEKWELLLVDNASTNLLSVTWDLAWHPGGRHVREDEQGLSFARRRGICEARGDVVVFVDDDNVVAPDYLSQVEAIMQDTSIGAAGGAVVPVFEENVSPPAHFYTYAGCFACGVQCGPDGISGGLFDLTGPDGVLFGAGLVVRRPDILDLLDLPHFPLLSGRKGATLSSGEDHEICHLIALKGQRLVYSGALKLQHLISESRLEPSYIQRFFNDNLQVARITALYIAARKASSMSYASMLKNATRVVLRKNTREQAFILAIFLNNIWFAHPDDRPAFRNVQALKWRDGAPTAPRSTRQDATPSELSPASQ
jgi:glycosyltransferase involved in cell wall biosynthesis